MKCRSTNLPKELKHVRNETEADEESTNEDCDTSDPSIHINLQDYTSSDNSDRYARQLNLLSLRCNFKIKDFYSH